MKLKKKNCFIALLILILVGIISYYSVDKYVLNSNSNKYEEKVIKQEEQDTSHIDEIEEQNISETEPIKQEKITDVVEKNDNKTLVTNTKVEEKKIENKIENKKIEEKKVTTEKKEDNKVAETKNENVVIEPINIEKVSYSKNIIKMVVGETIELNPTITPSNATNKELVYSTSNSNLVEVTQDGKVTALKTSLNPTYVYIKSKENPDISFSIRIYVFDDVRIESLKFQKSVETVDIATNGIIYKFKLNAPIVAADMNKYTYCGMWMEYTSSNPEVARVQVSNIDTLLLNKPGTTIITAKYRDGKTAQMELHVINSSEDQRTTDEKLKYVVEQNEKEPE